VLRQITIAASSSTNLEDALLNVVRGLQTVMPGDRIAVLMMAGDDLLQVNASTGFAGTRHLQAHVAPGQGIIGQAAVEKRPIRVDDALSDPRYVAIDPDVRSELAVPILFGEELLGVLDMESTRAAAFDENDQEIFGALGNNLGGVIANLRLVGQVRQQVLRERQLFEVTSKVRRSVDLGMILETSAQELARALGARKASIRIHAGPATLTVEEKRDGRNGSGDRQDQGAEGRKEWEEIP
jgi:sigma-B regulation protein RsbU (phosphoserine phosphatase)